MMTRAEREVALWFRTHGYHPDERLIVGFAQALGSEFSTACIEFVAKMSIDSFDVDSRLSRFEQARMGTISDDFAHYIANCTTRTIGWTPYFALYQESRSKSGIPFDVLTSYADQSRLKFAPSQLMSNIARGILYLDFDGTWHLDGDIKQNWGPLMDRAMRIADFEDGKTFERFDKYIKPFV